MRRLHENQGERAEDLALDTACIITFLPDDHVAEQAIRFVVIDRHVTRGRQSYERLWSRKKSEIVFLLGFKFQVLCFK